MKTDNEKWTLRSGLIAAVLIFMNAGLAVVAFKATAQAPVIGQGGAAPGPGIVIRGPHVVVGGPTPIIHDTPANHAICGPDANIEGSDVAGQINFAAGGDPTMQCQIDFAVPWEAGKRVFCLFESFDPSATFTAGNNNLNMTMSGFTFVARWHCIGAP